MTKTELNKYREECKRITAVHNEESLELAAEAVLTGTPVEEKALVLPKPPLYNLYLTKSDLKVLIVEAEVNRINWDRLSARPRPGRTYRVADKFPR